MTAGILDIFVDTEFSDDGRRIIPISLGAACHVLETEKFYTEISHNPDDLDPWVLKNVVPHLFFGPEDRLSPRDTSDKFAKWVEHVCEKADSEPRFWGYYASYDWVVICQLFGGLMKIPNTWPQLIIDLQVWSDMLGSPMECEPPRPDVHIASDDAEWNLQFFTNIGKKMGFPRW